MWVGCFANSGADRINGHTRDQSIYDCSPRALALGVPGFGMEYPQGYGYGKAQCLPLTTVPPAMIKVADADCEVETYSGFRLGGGYRLAVYAYLKPPVWVGCFLNSGTALFNGYDRLKGHTEDQSIADCSTLALTLRMPGFGMESPQSYGTPGPHSHSAKCLPLTTVPPQAYIWEAHSNFGEGQAHIETLTKVADAECEVEMHNGFRLGGDARLAVYTLG